MRLNPLRILAEWHKLHHWKHHGAGKSLLARYAMIQLPMTCIISCHASQKLLEQNEAELKNLCLMPIRAFIVQD